MRKLFIILYVTFAGLQISCTKQNKYPENDVSFFLLSNSTVILPNCTIDPATAVLQNEPFIYNDQIISYSVKDQSFFLNKEGGEAIERMKDNTPIAVTVDKQVIYYCIFKPMYSSSGCAGSITMSGFKHSDLFYEAIIRLGYPGQIQGVSIPDLRNDQRLVSALRNQGKLR